MEAPFKKKATIPRGPVIITLDIETSPIIAYTWGLWKQNIGLNQIIRDWTVLSYCAKTLGQRSVRYLDTADKDDPYDDADIMLALWHELDRADIIIVQNGVKFDLRKINARFLQMGLPPPSPYKLIDTMLEARKVAAFTSNKLEWLATVLTEVRKDKHHQFPGFELWTECLKKNPKAWAVMRKYNPKDVIATEKVYLRLRPYIVGHPNVAVYNDSEKVQCPKCGSTKVHKRGNTSTQTGEYHRYRCTSCMGWSRSRYVINTKGKRQALLSN